MPTKRTRMLSVLPQFRVVDLIRTAEHYRDVLGFQIEDYFGSPPVFTQASRDEVVLQLGKATGAEGATHPADGGGYNAYVWVDDVDALAKEYGERGANIVEGPVERGYKCRELVVRDCNGIILCFAEDRSRG